MKLINFSLFFSSSHLGFSANRKSIIFLIPAKRREKISELRGSPATIVELMILGYVLGNIISYVL